jgi:hypothetical protein
MDFGAKICISKTVIYVRLLPKYFSVFPVASRFKFVCAFPVQNGLI